jgi:AraC family transcriptional regulator
MHHPSLLDVRRVRHGPGPVVLGSPEAHRIRLVAGPAVRGSCGSDHFVSRAGDVDILPAGVADRWEEHDPGESIVVELAPAPLARWAEDHQIGPLDPSLAPRCLLRDARVEHVLRALDAERAEGWANGRLYADGLVAALAVHLLRHHGRRAPSRVPGGLGAMQLRRVRAYVEEHLAQDLTLARLAAVAGVGPSHFKTLFKRSMGVAAHDYVVQRRVERARELLLQGELPASQVALEAGFAHQSHMARWMKRKLGVTPSALRRGAR